MSDESVRKLEEAAALNDQHALALIHRHMLGAMGLGLIPFPALDSVAITALQVRMLREIARLYGFEMTRTQLFYSIIGSLTAGLGLPLALAPAVLGTFKIVPGFGTSVGMVSLPVIAGATTYALGRVFVQHFESGGTFLSFDARSMRAMMADAYNEGLKEARALQLPHPTVKPDDPPQTFPK